MSNNSDYEDKRYLFFCQEEMDVGEGEIVPTDDYGYTSSYATRRSSPTYIYELDEVVIPRAYEGEEVTEDFKEQKRPIKVTYV
jgi:hypothetical protein